MVDTLGLLWGRQVTSANTSDKVGFTLVYASVMSYLLQVLRVFADRGYQGTWSWLISVTGGYSLLEIVKPDADQKGFAVHAKRWIVERTISWLNWSRRLSKDYEQTTTSSQAWIDVSAIRFTLRKLAA